MRRSRSRRASMARWRSVLAIATLLAAGACTREDRAPAEAVRLIRTAAGTLPPAYTLADETRPVLAAPPEGRVQVAVPPDATATVRFPLPADLSGDTIVASGAFQRAKRVYPLAAELVTIGAGAAGGREGTLTLPALARGAGPPAQLTIDLTAPPAAGVVETIVRDVALPRAATLHFAYGLGNATGLPEAAPVALEVVALPAAGGERTLWSTTVPAADPTARTWREVAVALDGLGAQTLGVAFRARAAGPGVPVVVPLWADPILIAPAPRPPTRRNVVLVSLDTLRADRVGAYGAYRPTTPALDALAAESAVFTDAWAVWPETSGSHMSLFTARYPSEHGVTSFITAPSPALDLLAERLRREGYLTRAFTENGGVWAHAGFARGFSAYSERRSPDFVYRGEVEATFTDAIRWIDAHADRTFFLFVHTYEVHAPYTPPREYRTLFADIPGREPRGIIASALRYDREVRHTDDQVARLIATLRRLDLAERTILIVTSDHGEEFGEHGGMGHGRTLHREVLAVPLIVWAPGLARRARIDAPASLLDVYPTLLDLLGLTPDPSHRGASLAAAVRGETAPAPAARPIFGEVDRTERVRYSQASVRQEGRTAITDLTTGATRCYAASDPAEERPAGACDDLVALSAAHRATLAPVASRTPGVVDPALIEKMRALGYLDD